MATSKNDEVKDTGVPSNDAYTGMLVVSLLALIVGCVLLYLDFSQYPTAPPAKGLPPPEKAVPAAPPVVGKPPEDKKDGAPPMPDKKDMPEKKDM